MLTRLIVAKFGGGREPLQDLNMHVLELARALCHTLLESGVERTRFQKILHAQQYFGRVERLREKISDATGKCAALCVIAGIGGQHQHWQIPCGKLGSDRIEHSESVEPRHLQIEQNEIGLPCLRLRYAVHRIRRAIQGHKAGAAEDAPQRFVIVDDQNSRFSRSFAAYEHDVSCLGLRFYALAGA